MRKFLIKYWRIVAAVCLIDLALSIASLPAIIAEVKLYTQPAPIIDIPPLILWTPPPPLPKTKCSRVVHPDPMNCVR